MTAFAVLMRETGFLSWRIKDRDVMYCVAYSILKQRQEAELI